MLMKTWACQGERLDICRGCSNEPARNYLVQIGSSAQPYHLQLEDFSSVSSFKFVRSLHHQHHHHHHHRPHQWSSPHLVSLAAHIEDDRPLADLVGDDQERRWRVDWSLHCVTVHLVVHDLTEENYLFFRKIKNFLVLLISLDWL